MIFLPTMRKTVPENFSGLAQVQVDSYRTDNTSIFPGSSLAQFTNQEQEGDRRGCPPVTLWKVQENPARSWYEKVGEKSLGEKHSSIDDRDIVEIAYGWDTLETLLTHSTGKSNRS